MTDSTASLARDPVAVSIEDYLQHEAVAGHGPLRMREHPDEVTVSFGTTVVRGETYDIALLRLARVLMEDECFTEALIDRLRSTGLR